VATVSVHVITWKTTHCERTIHYRSRIHYNDNAATTEFLILKTYRPRPVTSVGPLVAPMQYRRAAACNSVEIWNNNNIVDLIIKSKQYFNTRTRSFRASKCICYDDVPVLMMVLFLSKLVFIVRPRPPTTRLRTPTILAHII